MVRTRGISVEEVTYLRNVALIVAVVLALGIGVTAAVANGPSHPATVASCSDQADQSQPTGVDEEQAAANDVTEAADDVEQEASSEQADDEAGDAQAGPDEHGTANDCGEQGDHGEQGDQGDQNDLDDQADSD